MHDQVGVNPSPSVGSNQSVELGIDGSINGETIAHATIGEIKLLAVPLIQLTNKIKMNEHDKIRELSQQLAIEKKRCAAYKRQLELLFEHIEEHNNSLSKKIQHIVGNVKEIEAEEQQRHR
ncbi:hypothetical protein Ahy_A08g039048 isoform B [Arachis hypogaea]|uniref:Uncharacterized protein n=1 Tax=Arachis hypogaea TaxID=3818 RepID=A0A445BV36_ARAHY|nr:hypothetical protein Ahy_A08g039048 isoform B [Arachis hypogaea]